MSEIPNILYINYVYQFYEFDYQKKINLLNKYEFWVRSNIVNKDPYLEEVREYKRILDDQIKTIRIIYSNIQNGQGGRKKFRKTRKTKRTKRTRK